MIIAKFFTNIYYLNFEEKKNFMHLLILALVILCSCSGPLPQNQVSSNCECCELEDVAPCLPCAEGMPQEPDILPVRIPVPFDEWGHDNAEAEGTWFTLKSTYTAEEMGLIKNVDCHAYSAQVIPFTMELERTHRMRFEDLKIYQFDDGQGVRWVRLILSTQNIMDLCQSRELIVDVVEGLLERLNSDPVILESFAHRPITASDLEIYISFESFYIEYLNPTFIAWISLLDGDVRYFSGVIKDFHKDWWNSRLEPYYKAKDIVMITRKAALELDKRYPRKQRISGYLNNL